MSLETNPPLSGNFDAGGKMSAWISVKERLPEETGEYIVSNGDWVTGEFYQDGKFYIQLSRIDDRITHWQPLPAPPDAEVLVGM